MSLPVIILGGGGHAKVLIEALLLRSQCILGITDVDRSKEGQSLAGVPVIGGDDIIGVYPPNSVNLVNGLGSVRVSCHRRALYERFKREGYSFESVIHPSAIVSSDVVLSEGVQIMAGVVIQVGSRIGENVIVNTRAIIDHDGQIGDHAHIAPGAILCGGVRVGENAHIGTGATVIQDVRVGRDSLVAAGAVVIRDVSEGVIVAGVPARESQL